MKLIKESHGSVIGQNAGRMERHGKRNHRLRKEISDMPSAENDKNYETSSSNN